jgi:hypothetical protein
MGDWNETAAVLLSRRWLGWTALHTIICKGFVPKQTIIANMLIKKARDLSIVWELISMKTDRGSTALHYAIGMGDVSLVKILISAADDIGKGWEYICMPDPTSCNLSALQLAHGKAAHEPSKQSSKIFDYLTLMSVFTQVQDDAHEGPL